MSFDRLAPHYRWMESVLAGELLHQIAAQVATAHQLHVAACQRVGVEAVLLNELGGHPQYAVGADVAQPAAGRHQRVPR